MIVRLLNRQRLLNKSPGFRSSALVSRRRSSIVALKRAFSNAEIVSRCTCDNSARAACVSCAFLRALTRLCPTSSRSCFSESLRPTLHRLPASPRLREGPNKLGQKTLARESEGKLRSDPFSSVSVHIYVWFVKSELPISLLSWACTTSSRRMPSNGWGRNLIVGSRAMPGRTIRSCGAIYSVSVCSAHPGISDRRYLLLTLVRHCEGAAKAQGFHRTGARRSDRGRTSPHAQRAQTPVASNVFAKGQLPSSLESLLARQARA